MMRSLLRWAGFLLLGSAMVLASLCVWGAAGTRLDLSQIHVPPAFETPNQARVTRPMSLTLVHPYLKWRTRDGTRAGYVMATAKKGALRYAIQHGVADLEDGASFDANSRFRIASMTKPITAVAAMILVEQGIINLHDPVSAYIPAFADTQVWESGGIVPANHEPTLRDLLTFTAGIGSANATGRPILDALWTEGLQAEWNTASLEQRVDAMALLPLYNHPGSAWHYGASLTVMARVIEVASGLSFEDFLQTEIFEPLGMNDTGFMPMPGKRDGLAALYTHDEAGHLIVRADPDYHPKGRVSGDGHLVSTLPDYMRFALMLWNRGTYQGQQILSETSVDLMTTPHIESGVLSEFDIQGLGWGFGLAIVMDAKATPMPDKVGDVFWSGVNGTHFWISPQDETVFVYMTQYRAPLGETGRPRGAEIPFVVQAVVNSTL